MSLDFVAGFLGGESVLAKIDFARPTHGLLSFESRFKSGFSSTAQTQHCRNPEYRGIAVTRYY